MARKREGEERVVKVEEVCEGKVTVAFWCIRDRDLEYWMSDDDYPGSRLWTRSLDNRLVFHSRQEAEDELDRFWEWRKAGGSIRGYEPQAGNYLSRPTLPKVKNRTFMSRAGARG